MPESLDEDVTARVARALAPYLDRMAGVCRQQVWKCEDGWLVVYSTSRVEGGVHHGKFVAMAYRPTGPGARTGKATSWERCYLRAFATRKAAKARAVDMFRRHSPGWDARRRA